MANQRQGKNWVVINGITYYQLTKTIGTKLNKNGVLVPNKIRFRGRTKTEALRKAQEYENRYKQGLATTKKSFGELADEWIETFFWNEDYSDRTKQRYVQAWNKYIRPQEFYGYKIEEISSKTIQEAYNRLLENGVAASSVKSANNLMKHFYSHLVNESLARDITTSIKLKRTVKNNNEGIKTWSDNEIKIILNSFNNNLSYANSHKRIRFLLNVAYYTGLRISEILGLKYEDFTEEGLRVNRQVAIKYKKDKNGNRTSELTTDNFLKTESAYRLIPLNEDLKKELQLHRKWQKQDELKYGYRTDYVFTTSSGTLYNKANVSRAAIRYYKEIGIDYNGRGFHTYRHTFGTNLCRAGVPIQEASVLLGHSDISVTQKYYVNVTQNAKQIAIDKLSLFVS